MIFRMRQESLLNPCEQYLALGLNLLFLTQGALMISTFRTIPITTDDTVLTSIACQRSPYGPQHPRHGGKADSSTSVGSQDHFSP